MDWLQKIGMGILIVAFVMVALFAIIIFLYMAAPILVMPNGG